MTIFETSLKDVVLMTIDEISKSGGALGRRLGPVVVDPALSWSLSAEKARGLLTQGKVAVTSGCWMLVSREPVLPAYEGLNGLLLCPI